MQSFCNSLSAFLCRQPRRVVVVTVLCCLMMEVVGADSLFDRLLDGARKDFNDRFYDRAESAYDSFIRNFPNSARVDEARLMLAHSRAERQMQTGDFHGAAAAFATILKDFPKSPMRLEAQLGEGLARYKLDDIRASVQLLSDADSPLQKAVRENASSARSVEGLLLLGEGEFQLADYKRALETVSTIPAQAGNSEVEWKRLSLKARIQAVNDVAAASVTATNLVNVSTNLDQPVLKAKSWALLAEVLQKLGRFSEAEKAWQKNLADDIPKSFRQTALLNIVRLEITQDRLTDAIERFTSFLSQFPDDPDVDSMRLSLAELRLRSYYSTIGRTSPRPTPTDNAAATNRLAEAKSELDLLLTKSTNSPLIARALFNRGWCAWELAAETNRASASIQDFSGAAQKLPHSENQAVAFFKWADCQFLLHEYAPAITNYNRVVDEFADIPQIKNVLVDQALYQVVRAGIRATNVSAAEKAMRRLINLFPDSLYGDRTMLLVSQELNRTGEPAKARELLEEFALSFTNSALIPEVQLTLAQTYAQQENWPAAIHDYSLWLTNNVKHAAYPRALYDLGFIYDRAGSKTNTLNIFSNIAAIYPTHTNAANAIYWLADYYFQQDENDKAERYSQLLFNPEYTNTPVTMRYLGRLMAARAAFRRSSFNDAEDYLLDRPAVDPNNVQPGLLTLLVRDGNQPELMAKTWFLAGDIAMNRAVASNSLAGFSNAIPRFAKIPETNELGPRALAEIASCWYQLASVQPDAYTNAAAYYRQSMSSPLADIQTRSLAELGLGKVFERQAELPGNIQRTNLLEQALNHYLNVARGTNLHVGEKAHPAAVKDAGLAAARLLEVQKDWQRAVKVYQRLQQEVPALRYLLEPKIKNATLQLAAEKK